MKTRQDFILFVGAIFTVLELDKTKKEEENRSKK